MRDADRIFHETWLGLAQPIEGLVFSVPALADAQVNPAAKPQLTAELRAQLVPAGEGRVALASCRRFFEEFLGYRGALVERGQLPTFYAPESEQEIKASFGVLRTLPAASDDPFAEFDAPVPVTDADAGVLALVWDLGDDAADPTALDLDAAEAVTGPWRYPPTAKFERLLRHAGIPVGLLSNRRQLRLIYAPAGETTSHLTFRMDDLVDPAGRPMLLALDVLLHARRTYSADARFTFEGLLAESRRRQADVTEQLAEQVKEAVEALLGGLESAANRDAETEGVNWLGAAMEAEHVHEGVLNTILRLVFVLYAEDRSLLPVANPLYATHFSVLALYERLLVDAGAHPESMHDRFGGYGALISLFRAVYFGVQHGELSLPARQGKLFDPSAYPFLEGGLPGWTAAVSQPQDRAQVALPSVDDGAVLDVLHGLIVLDGQRLSYRDLSVEQIGAVYESLMGYRVVRVQGAAVRLGKSGYWLELEEMRGASKSEQNKLLDDRCELSTAAQKNVLAALAENADLDAAADAVSALANKRDRAKNRARAGQLVLQPTASRRSTGSHYTPRSLTERVVRRTLEPVLACLGAAPKAEQILSLKVCDPAMGSGAFLVEACRHLAEQVVEAWRRAGELPKQIEKHGDPLRFAKRLVAERCLYGVDKNAAAVELAKLSLWLETLSAERSFTFLDHVLCHGDSLVGLDLEQIRAFHWAPQKQAPLVRGLVDRAMLEVREYREAILALADDETPRAQRDKRRLLELAEMAQRRVQLVADACVGAFFAADKPKAREAERLRRLDVVQAWLSGDERRRGEIEGWSDEIRVQHAPFHWHVVWPEVFFIERADPLDAGAKNQAAFMDAFVGNPPFMGGSSISSNSGAGYLAWLLELHRGSHGNGDLCAHFFRRASRLIGRHGTLGFVATNTIAQGDTRSTGLQYLVNIDGCEVFDATVSMPWPGAAAVSVSVVALAKGKALAAAPVRMLDGHPVHALDSQLRAGAERSALTQLSSNAHASFLGSKIYGEGFTLTTEERSTLVTRDTSNASRVFPYLGGQEINTSPTQAYSRYVISFGQMSLQDAEAWPDLTKIVREKVKPDRDKLREDTGPGKHGKKYWWQFQHPRMPLYDAIAGLERCLVNSRVSKHLSFAFQPTDRIFSEALYVYPLPTHSSFAVLQSRIHEPWARLLSSSMKNDLRYAASDCFETFPFPEPDPRTVLPALEAMGERLYTTRAQYMIDTDQGLTKTYNQLKDPACTEPRILALRALHEAMDRAVLDAYGWQDLPVPPFCPSTPVEETALEQFKEAVIDRLFALNATRAAEEARLGLGKKAKPTATKAASRKPTPPPSAPPPGAQARTKKPAAKRTKAKQSKLFDGGES